MQLSVISSPSFYSRTSYPSVSSSRWQQLRYLSYHSQSESFEYRSVKIWLAFSQIALWSLQIFQISGMDSLISLMRLQSLYTLATVPNDFETKQPPRKAPILPPTRAVNSPNLETRFVPQLYRKLQNFPFILEPMIYFTVSDLPSRNLGTVSLQFQERGQQGLLMKSLMSSLWARITPHSFTYWLISSSLAKKLSSNTFFVVYIFYRLRQRKICYSTFLWKL